MNIIMGIIGNIINMFLTGLMYILAAAVIFGVIALALMVTWMQATEERNESYGRKEEAQEGNGHPAEKRHRRRTAGGYPCQMP